MVETALTVGDPSWLWPEEQPVVTNAVAARRYQFALGRRCARLAMGGLGVEATAVGRGDNGEPLWPDGIVGSITHTDGFAAAAVARGGCVVGLGLDVEPNLPLPDGAARLVIRPEEAGWIATGGSDRLCPDRLIFCAKEAVYKVWFPLASRWLDFKEASITAEPEDATSGSFHADILIDGPIGELRGRYLIDGEYLLTAVELAA